MASNRHRSPGFHTNLHDWLVVFFVTVLSLGEPAILQAGPCEDCENTKLKDLADCCTDFARDEAKCVTDAETAQTICINNENGKFAQADIDRKSSLRTAIGRYYIAIGICAVMPPPAPLPCLYTASGVYFAAIAQAERDYQTSVAKAEVERGTCDENWQATLKGCRKTRDNNLKFCEQKANDKYDRCKKNCNGPPEI